MRRRSEKQGFALARKFEASGLSQAEFARRRRVNAVVLRYWLRRSRQGAAPAKEPVRFVELDAGNEPADGPVVIVRLNRLPTAAYLAELLFGICRA